MQVIRQLRAQAIARFAALPDLWREPVPVPRTIREGLDVPLHPSRLLRWMASAVIASEVVYAIELALLGHPLASAIVAAMSVVCCALRWRAARDRASAPRRLLVSAAGRIHLLTARGDLLAVCLCRSSAHFGPWLALVLVAGRSRHRLLLGPDNLEPASLAALRRRLLSLRNPSTAGIWPLPEAETKSPGTKPGDR